ncbi:MAG: peptide chain release factor 1 [Lentisphaerae bacterium RIFOXYC12_FULL_60_16]|nr:MAG: peptide chain release factor 1 [Lentisphaerae bacterium RIFOXYC12_FULL_60_16]
MIDPSQIKGVLNRLPEVERELSDPRCMTNQKRYRELVQEHLRLSRLQEKATLYFNLQETAVGHRALIDQSASDLELAQLAREELPGLESRIPLAEQELMVALLPPDPAESRSAIMEIRAGTGGEEASLFAGDLFRMYQRYASERGWKVSIVDLSASEKGGTKELVCSIEGVDVYGVLRYESGVHRVQRVPVTEASGRIHTSAATVAVFPEADAQDDIEIKPDEIRVDIFCASGPGGQGVNTTYSAIRITHLPTGVVAQSQDERSQHRNKERAIQVLKARLLDARRQAEEMKMGDSRRSQIGSGDRSERVRTYNFPQNRLTDHRINLTLYSLNRIIEGDMGDLLAALRRHDLDLRIRKASGG